MVGQLWSNCVLQSVGPGGGTGISWSAWSVFRGISKKHVILRVQFEVH